MGVVEGGGIGDGWNRRGQGPTFNTPGMRWRATLQHRPQALRLEAALADDPESGAEGGLRLFERAHQRGAGSAVEHAQLTGGAILDELRPPPQLGLEAAGWEAQLGFVRVRGLPVDELHARHHDLVVVGEVGRLHLLARHLGQLVDCRPRPGTEGEDVAPRFSCVRRHRRQHRLGYRPTIVVLHREVRDGFQHGCEMFIQTRCELGCGDRHDWIKRHECEYKLKNDLRLLQLKTAP